MHLAKINKALLKF